nr:ABC transporter ATP-binding protein [Halovenus salina]
MKGGALNRSVGFAKAVDGVSFDIYPGETLGLVGESGCGKSTVATSLVRLEEPTDGSVIFNGGEWASTSSHSDTEPRSNDVTTFDKRDLKRFRRGAQMIFQDPSSSFDPRMTVGGSVAEMLLVHGMDDKQRRRAIVEDLLERVGLSAEDYDRYPHEFSGGQKQRIALARALVLNPDFIVADEPVSALDVSIKAEILSLLKDIQEEFNLSMLFISHDMSVIREVCDRVAVMYLGEIVELGQTETIFNNPKHPYTEALISAIPTPDPRTSQKGIKLEGTVPDPSNPPSGCKFHTRCHRVIQPDRWDLDQQVWRRLLNFRDRIQAGAIELDTLRENVTRQEDKGAVSADDAITSEIRKEFNLPQKLDDPDAESTLAEATEALADDDFERAAQQLTETFTTPCEETDPAEVSHSDTHTSACLLNDEEQSPMNAATTND